MVKLLKIEGVNVNIEYIYDGQIPKANLHQEKIIISRGKLKGNETIITTIIKYARMKRLSKPYKLRIRAESQKSGKRRIAKRDFIYTDTLHRAVQDAEKQRLLLLDEVIAPIISSEQLLEIPTFKVAFEKQLKSKKIEYKSINRNYNDKDKRQFADKWLYPLYNKKLDKIRKEDLTSIMSNMTKKDGTPLAVRTKQTVPQTVKPVYTWINQQPNFNIDSPTKNIKITKPDNKRDCPFSVEGNKEDIQELKLHFRKLFYYALNKRGNRVHDQIRWVYVWLLHGRRLNEILTLEWEDIDLKNNTYCIRAEKNKARIDMGYILTQYQREAIGIPKKEGWVFPSINDPKKHLSKETMRNHDKGLVIDGMHKHDLRHCIGGYLINKGILSEVIGVIIGHTQNKTITDRYAQVTKKTANNAIISMLDDLLGTCLSSEEILNT